MSITVLHLTLQYSNTNN